MTLNAPTQMLFLVAVVVAIVALIGAFVPSIPFIGLYPIWLMTAAFVVLAGACLFKGA